MSESRLSPLMYPRRALRAALFLIAVECLMLGYPPGDWLVTGGLLLWAASRWWSIRSGWCINTPVIWNSQFLAILFVSKWMFLPVTFSTDTGFANSELAHEVGCWLVTVQILILHAPSSLKRVPPAVAALGCIVVLCAGDLQLRAADAQRAQLSRL